MVRKFVDSWPVVVVAALLALTFSWGGVGVATADSPAAERKAVSSPDRPEASRRSVQSIVAEAGQQCQAGAVGEAALRADYDRRMAEVKRRLAAKAGDPEVITLNSRGHNYGPERSPSMPLDIRPPAPGS